MDDSSLGGEFNQPSAVAPNWILPSIYVAHANKTMRFPGDIAITNVSPVPSTAIGAVVATNWRKPTLGGDRVTRAVRPFTQWRPFNNGASA